MYSAFFSTTRPKYTEACDAVLAYFGYSCGPFDRLFWRVWERLRALFAAGEMRGGQSRQSAGQARAQLAGSIVVAKPTAWSIAWDGCMKHYGYDPSALPPHERVAIRNAVQAALTAGDSLEICMMVAAIKLREICPSVNGILESK